MPIYEYKCQICGHAFEKLLFHGVEEVHCPVCSGRVNKLMSPFSIEVPDEICGKLPRGEAREVCTECKQGGAACPYTAQ